MSLNKTKYKVCAALGENLWSSSKIGRFRKKKWSRVQGQGLKVHYPQTSKTQVHLQPSVYLYGNRLKAKQKLRKFYGNLSEKSFHALYKKSLSRDNFIGLLESRLDTLVFRMNFSPTPFAARQLISHGAILVNGKKATIKSALLKPGDCIEVKAGAWPRVYKDLEDRLKAEDFFRPVPNHLEVSFSSLKGIYLYEPIFTEVPYGVPMHIDLVKEFYK